MHLMVRFIIFFYNVRVPFFLLLYPAFLVPFFYIYIFYLLSSYGCSALYFLSLAFSLVHGIFFTLFSFPFLSIFCSFFACSSSLILWIFHSFSSQVFWNFLLVLSKRISLISCSFATPPVIWEENLLFSLTSLKFLFAFNIFLPRFAYFFNWKFRDLVTVVD